MRKILSITSIVSLITSACFLTSCSNNDTWKRGYIQNHPTPLPATILEARSDTVKYEKDQYGIIDLRGTKVDSEHLSKISVADLNNVTQFDTVTEWSEDLPKGFEPWKLIEDGKKKKLELGKLHDKGYDGEGIGIAMIDATLLVNHVEIKDNVKFYKNFSSEKDIAAMHGVAMASIAVGKYIGVAPKADLYFVGDDFYNFEQKKVDFTKIADDILNIIELNNSLKNKIRVISISSGYSDMADVLGTYELSEAIKKAEENNIEVLCLIPGNKIFNFSSATRVSYSDVNDITKFMPYFDFPSYKNIYVPTDKITWASFLGEEEYAYAPWGGMSAIVPYVAGLYVLACQADSSITFEKFCEIANYTANETEYISEQYGKQKFRLIDPNAIIENLIK